MEHHSEQFAPIHRPPRRAEIKSRVFSLGSIAGVTPSVIGRSGQRRRDVVEINGHSASTAGIHETAGTSSSKGTWKPCAEFLGRSPRTKVEAENLTTQYRARSGVDRHRTVQVCTS